MASTVIYLLLWIKKISFIVFDWKPSLKYIQPGEIAPLYLSLHPLSPPPPFYLFISLFLDFGKSILLNKILSS